MPSFILIRLTVWPRCTNVTDRQDRQTAGQTDRQRSDSIGRTVLQTVAQKRLNRSICRLGCGVGCAKGSRSSIVFARWRQCALMGEHVAATWRTRLNYPYMASMRLMFKLLGPLVIIGHAHLDSSTDSQALRAEYCVVGIPHNTTI